VSYATNIFLGETLTDSLPRDDSVRSGAMSQKSVESNDYQTLDTANLELVGACSR